MNEPRLQTTEPETVLVTGFKEVPTLEFGDIEMEVMPPMGGHRKWIEIADTEGAGNLMLTVDEARALRDWLNKVLP